MCVLILGKQDPFFLLMFLGVGRLCRPRFKGAPGAASWPIRVPGERAWVLTNPYL